MHKQTNIQSTVRACLNFNIFVSIRVTSYTSLVEYVYNDTEIKNKPRTKTLHGANFRVLLFWDVQEQPRTFYWIFNRDYPSTKISGRI